MPEKITSPAHKEMQPGAKLARSFLVERSAVNEEARTVELAFSSETPYRRWWGIEILDHKSSSIRLGRLKSGGPLLMDHDSRDHIGVIESVAIGADRVGRAVVRFGRSARAEEIFRDVIDGIRRNVSVGYQIHNAVLDESQGNPEEGGTEDTYRVTDWEPFEISLVSVPADASVGVGRSADDGEKTDELPATVQAEIDTDSGADGAAQKTETETKTETVIQLIHEEKAMPNPVEIDPVVAERKRVSDVQNIGDQFKNFAGVPEAVRAAVNSDMSVDQFRQQVLDIVSRAPKPTADIGMNEREVKQFSFLRAFNALANPTDRKAQEAASFERECSDAFGQKYGRSAQGFFVPVEVQKRDLTVGTNTAGGHTVSTNLLASSFIELLRNKMVMTQLGAIMLTDLIGNIALPRQTGGATAYWVAESGAPTESQQAFDQVTMSPKTVGAFTDISRKLLLQSSLDVEAFVRNDLAQVLALAIDLAAINGSGASNQPTGILNTSGIGAVAGGTNGLAPAWDHIVDLESAVSIANADVGTLAYLTNTKVRGKLKKTSQVSGQNGFIWEKGAEPLNGYRAAVSNQVPSNLTKGTANAICSAIIFGNFADLIIGQWGALDLTVDPYTNSASGTLRIVALQDVDIAVRHAESFAAMKDALTT